MRISDWSSDVCSSDLLRIVRAGVAREIPARLHESVEGIGLARRRTAALRADAFAPFRIGLDRRLHTRERNVFRQHHRQLVFRHRHRVTLVRSEEHTSELQSLMRTSYAVFCLKKQKKQHHTN